MTGEVTMEPIIQSAPSTTARSDLGKTIVSLAQVIVRQHDGDAARLLEGNVTDILRKLQKVHGIGPGISRMIVIQRMLFFGLEPSSADGLLPKIDVMVERVFKRARLVKAATDEEMRSVLSNLTAREIAIVDQIAWMVGRTYCFPDAPDCTACCLSSCCLKIGVG